MPSPEAIGKCDEVLLHSGASLREEAMKVDAVVAVRPLGEQVALNRLCQLTRCRTVVGPNDPVRHEDAIEGNRGVAVPRECVVPPDDAVVNHPCADQGDGWNDEGGGGYETHSRRHTDQERHKHHHEEHLITRPNQRQNPDTGPECSEPSHRRRKTNAHREERPTSECRREDGVGRELVKQDPVPGIHEKHDNRRQGSPPPEPTRRKEPGDDRCGIEKRDRRLRQPPTAEIEESADNRRSDGCSAEHIPEIDRIRLEELHVGTEVSAEVSPGPQRDDERLDPPYGEPCEKRRGHGCTGLGEGDCAGQDLRHSVPPRHTATVPPGSATWPQAVPAIMGAACPLKDPWSPSSFRA